MLAPTDLSRQSTVVSESDLRSSSGSEAEAAAAEQAEAVPVAQPLSPLMRLLTADKSPSRAAVREAVFNEARGWPCKSLADLLRTPGPRGWPPLVIAAQRRHAEAMAELLALGADTEGREPESGWTPLMYAATTGDLRMVQGLLSHGASVNAFASPHDWNPLCAAILSGREDVVSALLDAGADLKIIKKRHPDLAETYDELRRNSARRCPCGR